MCMKYEHTPRMSTTDIHNTTTHLRSGRSNAQPYPSTKCFQCGQKTTSSPSQMDLTQCECTHTHKHTTPHLWVRESTPHHKDTKTCTLTHLRLLTCLCLCVRNVRVAKIPHTRKHTRTPLFLSSLPLACPYFILGKKWVRVSV